MTSNDWSQTESAAANVATPDLFGGELFGDELMEMYNSDAVVGASNDIANDMPNLLSSVPSIYDSSTPANEANESNHPGAEVALTATAIDDGLGAFRPSTSFSDLASLLPETTPSSVPSSTTVPPATLSTHSSFASASEATVGQKRITASSSCGTKISEPPQKKRATGAKRTNTATKRGSAKSSKPNLAGNMVVMKSSVGKAALKLRKENQASTQASSSVNNTPNPLSGGVPPVAVRKFTNDQTSLLHPAVVTPRTCQKGDSITSEAAAAAAAVAAAASVPVPPPVTSSGATTEADFKSVAQAAVTNLILNAGASKTEGSEDAASTDDAVDTSTAHIKALTSSNWVAACSGGTTAGNAAAAAADPKANRARRQNLTPDERARQNRDRNREHARNTRLRKKAYVEELKRTLTELVSQRDQADIEKRHSAQRELEQREVRFRVMEEFLKLRGRQETSYSRWVAILEDHFTLTLPITDYRKMVETNGVSKSEQTLNGASEAMGDAVHLGSFLQTLGSGNEGIIPSTAVTLQYQCDRKNFFMDGCNGVLTWTATTVGAVGQGTPVELSLKGNMRAKFSPASNKLINAEILFDTGSIASQLQRVDAPKLDRTEELATKGDLVAAVEAAEAQAVANEADALLDSLQMPQLGSAVPTAITVMPTSQQVGTASAAVSVTSSDKDDSSDESVEDGPTHDVLLQVKVEG